MTSFVLISQFFALCLLLIEDTYQTFSTDDNGILLLNNETYQDAVNKFQTFFPLLYVNDAPEAQRSINIINDVANELKMRNIEATIAKVSLEYDNNLFNRYNSEGVSAFLAIMEHGERFVEFTESLDKVESIIVFIKRKLESPVKHIDDPDLLRTVIEDSPCISVGFFENFTTPEYEEFKSNADWYYHCDHFASTNRNLFQYFKVEDRIPTIKMYKGCIHDYVDFPNQLPLQGMHILKFFIVAMEPDVMKFGLSWLTKRNFKEPQFSLLLFVSKDDRKKQSYIDIMEKYARQYREEINMAYAEVDGDEDVSMLLYTFDDSPKDVPFIRAIELSNRYGNNTRKYKPKRKTINSETVKRFIGDVFYRQLQPYLISEKLPDDWNQGPIKTIVGDNFQNITEDVMKTVLVVFYKDEKKYVSLVNGQLSQLASDLAGEGRTDVVISKSNYVSNEYFGWHPDKFPSIILFPKGLNKFGIIYTMDLFYENLKLFIESDGKINENPSAKDNSNIVSEETSDDDDEGVIVETEYESNQTAPKTEL